MNKVKITCEGGTGVEESFKSPIKEIEIREEGKVTTIYRSFGGWVVYKEPSSDPV